MDPNQPIPEYPPPAGLLVVDKHVGPTSSAVCTVIRRRLRNGGAPKRVKVGHAGTLDPRASGVLVVMIGKATRLCARYMDTAKRYEALVDLSRVSSTDDEEGQCTLVESAAPTRERIEEVSRGFVGAIMQAPPVYSAVWVAGKRAYDLARRGRAPVLPEREVRVDAIEILSYEWPLLRLDIRCGKGVYIRSMARDIGKALGTGGMLAALRRTAVGEFTVDQAIGLDDVPNVLVQAHLIPPPSADTPDGTSVQDVQRSF